MTTWVRHLFYWGKPGKRLCTNDDKSLPPLPKSVGPRVFKLTISRTDFFSPLLSLFHFVAVLPSIAMTPAIESNGIAGYSEADNGLYYASTSAAPLAPSQAVAHLSSYESGDGLSMAELVDSRLHGGLTYNGEHIV